MEYRDRVVLALVFLSNFLRLSLVAPQASLLHPNGLAATRQGGGAIFTCSSTLLSIMNVTWMIGGSRDFQLSNVQVLPYNRALGFGTLQFTDVPLEYNDTTIQCFAIRSSGDEVPSMTCTLLVQGPPSAVEYFTATADIGRIFLNWSAPLTLDLTGAVLFEIADSAITYCVNVFCSNSSALLYTKCGLSDTEFSYTPLLMNNCEKYSFSVIPVNEIGNGTSTQATQRLLVSPTTVTPQTHEGIVATAQSTTEAPLLHASNNSILRAEVLSPILVLAVASMIGVAIIALLAKKSKLICLQKTVRVRIDGRDHGRNCTLAVTYDILTTLNRNPKMYDTFCQFQDVDKMQLNYTPHPDD